MTAKKYVAKLDGKIVGTRTTKNRTYSHAIIAQRDEAKARDAAYNYKPTKTDRSNFDYHVSIVACEGKVITPTPAMSDLRKANDAGQVINAWATGKRYVSGYSAEDIAESKAKIKDGFDGYLVYLRNKAIETFEANLADGYFKPGNAAWAGRLDLAQKEAANRAKWFKNVWIVPAEEVVK